ncbi:MAG: hypothetical protein ABI194_07395 [Gemmatimonadaceae bacterium]
MTSNEAGEHVDSGTPAPPPGVPRRRSRRLWLKIGLPLIAVVILGAAAWVWVTLGFVYSSAQRTGYVVGLSQRGWLCKTWEGQLSVSKGPGVADSASTFKFTIPDDSVARALQKVSGQQVTLSYDEHRGIPSSCFGETENFVRGFRPAQ